jgi:type II secretion system protein H
MAAQEATMTLRTGKSKSDEWRETSDEQEARAVSFFHVSRLTHHAPRMMHHSAFTLVELILVMAVLLVVLGVVFPSLKGFFRGRSLDSEARRFLSLTRYGHSRAVSEGVPMTLWIDAKQSAYGLQAAAGYLDSDAKAVQFTLGEQLQVEAQIPVVSTRSSQWSPTMRTTANSTPTIRFLPDGSVAETSPDRVLFRQSDTELLWVVQSRNRLNYEIQTSQSPNAAR